MSSKGKEYEARMESAKVKLKEAVAADEQKRPNDAFTRYMEGIEELMQCLSLLEKSDAKYTPLRAAVDKYVSRATELQKEIKIEVSMLEQRKVESGSTGHGYDRVFAKCIDGKLSSVRVQDAYMGANHQFLNFLRFCELLVSGASRLRIIQLITSADSKQNQVFFSSNPSRDDDRFADLGASLEQRGIRLAIDYRENLHDRQIEFDNGWIVKIGRGLDYFLPAANRNGLGAFDMNLRPCKETTIDIFRRK